MIIGPAIAAGGMIWLSRLSEHSTYASGVLGPTILTGLGIGLVFVPLSLVSLAGVHDDDAGSASSLLNVGQQIGGSIGLAIVGTVAWSAVASNLRSASAAAGTTHLSTAAQTAMSDHAMTYGFSQGYQISAGIAVLALIVSVIFIRVKKKDLEGIDPMAAPAA
jgi:ABC-type multidrug transport system permease subunit